MHEFATHLQNCSNKDLTATICASKSLNAESAAAKAAKAREKNGCSDESFQISGQSGWHLASSNAAAVLLTDWNT